MSAITIFIYFMFAINIVTMLLYVIDKRKARKGQWRISEKILLTWALFAPGGAFAGMKLAHHKTQQKKFMILVPLFMLLHICILMGFVYYKVI